MTDYIYGYDDQDGCVWLYKNLDEDDARERYGVRAVMAPVSAIEPLPEPKPVLPTTPGSVVRGFLYGQPETFLRTPGHGRGQYSEEQHWTDTARRFWADYAIEDWSLIFDAGAHDEGKTIEHDAI